MHIPSPSDPLVAIAVALLVGATITDVRSRRIPNALTLPAIAGGLLIRSFSEGWTGLLAAVGGVLAAPFVLLAIRGFRRLGMGDVKLAAAVGALLGPVAGGLAMLVSAVAGGLLALVFLLRPGTEGARALSPFFLHVPVLERLCADPAAPGAAGPAGASAAAITIPYGVAIAVGSLLTLGVLRWS